MSVINFEQYWNSRFSKSPPIGYLLRQNYPELWFRIHTLPESKRYPESEDEYQEMLRRHNTLLSDLFGNRVICLLLTGYSRSERPVRPRHLQKNPIQLSYAMSIPMHIIEHEDYKRYWHIWINVLEWKDGAADYLLRKVANDEIGNILFVETQGHQVYHPYDGGADIILTSPDQVSSYKAKYQAWLSNHPLGL